MSPPSSGSRNNPSKKLAELATCFNRFLAWLILRPWSWSRHVLPKRRLTFSGLHGVTSQKIVLILTNITCEWGSQFDKGQRTPPGSSGCCSERNIPAPLPGIESCPLSNILMSYHSINYCITVITTFLIIVVVITITLRVFVIQLSRVWITM
jgi:hypothetical protein